MPTNYDDLINPKKKQDVDLSGYSDLLPAPEVSPIDKFKEAVKPNVSRETIPRTSGDRKRMAEGKSIQERQQMGMNILNPYTDPEGELIPGEATAHVEAFTQPIKQKLQKYGGIISRNVPEDIQQMLQPDQAKYQQEERKRIKNLLKSEPVFIEQMIRKQTGQEIEPGMIGSMLKPVVDKLVPDTSDLARFGTPEKQEAYRKAKIDEFNAKYPGIVTEAIDEYSAEKKKGKELAKDHPVLYAAGTVASELPEMIGAGYAGKLIKAPQALANLSPGIKKVAQGAFTGGLDFAAWSFLQGDNEQEIENSLMLGSAMGASFASLPIAWSAGRNFKKQRSIAKRLMERGVEKDAAHNLSKQYIKGNINKYELLKKGTKAPQQVIEAGKYKELVKPYKGKPAKLVEGRETLRGKARGAFYGKEAEITQAAEKGTGIHEAFHFFKENAASKKLYSKAAKAVPIEIQRKGELAVEEYLANKFARYRLGKESVTGKMKTFFQDMASKARGNAQTQALFKQFEQGKLGKGIPGQMKYQEIIQAPRDVTEKLFKPYSYETTVKPEVIQKAVEKRAKVLTRKTFAAGKQAKRAEVAEKLSLKQQRAKAVKVLKDYSPQKLKRLQKSRTLSVDTAERISAELEALRLDKAYKNMSTEEIMKKKNLITEIANQDRRKMKIKKALEKQWTDEVVKRGEYEMTKDIEMGIKNPGKEMLKTFDKEQLLRSEGIEAMSKNFKNIKSKAIISHSNANSLTTIMSGGNKKSAVRKAIYDPVKAGRRKELTVLDKISSPYKERRNSFFKKIGNPHKIDSRYGFTPNEKYAIIRNVDDPANALEFYRSHPEIKESKVKKMIKELTQDEKAMLDADRMFYKQWADEVKPIYRKIENKDFASLDKYYPREYKPGQGYARQDIAQSLLESRGIKVKDIDKGFGKSRGSNIGKKYRLDFIGTADRHSERISKYVGYAENYPKSKKILNRLKSTISEQYGNDTSLFLEQWMNDVVTGTDRTTGWAEGIGEQLRGMTYGATLGLNPSIPINQVASYLNGIAEIGEGAMLKGSLYVNKSPRKAIEEMHKMSVFMKHRSWEMAALDAKHIAKKGRLGKTLGKLSEIQMKPIGAVDQWTTAQVFHGARLDWLKKHPGDLKGAIKFAEEAVEVSQPMTDVLFRTGIHRGGELSKQYGMYMTQVMQSWNKAMVNRVLKKAGKISGTKHMRNLLYATILPAALVNVSRKLGFTDFTAGTIKNLIGLVPGGSLGVSIAEAKSSREIPGAILKAQAPTNAVWAVLNAIKKEGKMTDKMWNTLNKSLEAYLIANSVGVPSIKRMVKGQKEYWSGEDKDFRRLLGKSRFQIGGDPRATSGQAKLKALDRRSRKFNTELNKRFKK